MCNQFQLPTLADIKKYLVNDLNLPLIEPDKNLPQNQEVFPKGAASVLLYQNDQLQLQAKIWGYPSPFDHQKVLFNARVERFFEQKKSMWDSSFAKYRCIIIASQFFESSPETYVASNNHEYHEHYYFQTANEPLTLIAGIYQKDHFSMVTTQPSAAYAKVHDRMPLVIKPSELRQWLFQDFSSLVDRSHFQFTSAKLPQRQ